MAGSAMVFEPDTTSFVEPGAKFSLHTNYFLFQKVDVAANTMAAVASESEKLVTAGLQICLQFNRVGIRGKGDGSLLANMSNVSRRQLP